MGRSEVQGGNKKNKEEKELDIQVHETVMMFSRGKTKDGAQSHASVNVLRLSNLSTHTNTFPL